jgi:branched-chain amino acid transport system ATP-binding protein
VDLLRTHNLTKRFNGLVAVDDVNLTVQAGRLTSIIGPNGAGKTTLFNLLTGLLKADNGKIFFEGDDITRFPPYKIVKRGIARSFQLLNIFNDLTLFENIRITVQAAQGHGLEILSSTRSLEGVNQKTLEIVEAVGLRGKENYVAKTLSYGDRRVLEIGIALASSPKVILLDEPTSGLASKDTGRMSEFINQLSKNLTVVLIEHDMNIVLSISDHVIVLHQGRVIAQGTPSEMRNNDEVQDAYLGGL